MLTKLFISNILIGFYLLYKRGIRVHVETIDGRRYLVKPTGSNSSAKLLAELNDKKNKLCNYLDKQSKYDNHYGVQQLLKNKNVVIEEVAKKYKNQAAYSINKGERIGICLRNKKNKYENKNTMFFVLIHELAHIMTKEFKHNDKFWKNMSLLIENATNAKLYKYTEYKTNPESYCGHDITHNPYKRNK